MNVKVGIDKIDNLNNSWYLIYKMCIDLIFFL